MPPETNYREKDLGRYVEAWRFDGSYASMAEVIAEHRDVWWQRGLIRFRKPSGSQVVEPGEWLVRADNAWRVATAEAFGETYEPAEGGE